MEIVFSIVAIVIALTGTVIAWMARGHSRDSAASSERSARAAEKIEVRDDERRHDELQPDVTVSKWERLEKQGGYILNGVRIRVKGPLDYEEVTGRIVSVPGEVRAPIINVIAPVKAAFGGLDQDVSLGPAKKGTELRLGLQPSVDGDGRMVGGAASLILTFRAVGHDRPWEVNFDVELPPTPFFVR